MIIEKKELLERALAIDKKHLGSDHFEVAITLVNLGNAYYALGDSQKAKELLERALAIQGKYYGSDHFKVATTLINLSSAHGDLGDHKKKKSCLNGLYLFLRNIMALIILKLLNYLQILVLLMEI